MFELFDECMRLPITPITLMASLFITGLLMVWFYGFIKIVDCLIDKLICKKE
tara:strand:- start:847 stop:1002 length:156 start_codon:yes stop_codon:yes gene_type:complete